MHKYSIGLMAAILLGSTGAWATAQEGKTGKKEIKKLQGTWVAKKGDKTAVMKITGDNFTFKMGDSNDAAIAVGKFTIDTSKNPNTIDMKIVKGEGDPIQQYIGKTALGIYKLDGNTLTWCANEPGNASRPTALVDDGGDHLLLTFERKKKQQ